MMPGDADEPDARLDAARRALFARDAAAAMGLARAALQDAPGTPAALRMYAAAVRALGDEARVREVLPMLQAAAIRAEDDPVERAATWLDVGRTKAWLDDPGCISAFMQVRDPEAPRVTVGRAAQEHARRLARAKPGDKWIERCLTMAAELFERGEPAWTDGVVLCGVAWGVPHAGEELARRDLPGPEARALLEAGKLDEAEPLLRGSPHWHAATLSALGRFEEADVAISR
jgi:hypothetical protein